MKKIYEHFILWCAAVFICTAANAQEIQTTIRVVVFGDSLTSGYQLQPQQAFPAKLERKLKAVGFTTAEVINMSQSGETTAGGYERLSTLQSQRPDIVVVALGSNDVLRGIAPQIIQRNLTAIIDPLVKSGVYVVLVGAKAPPNMGTDYAAQIDTVYEALATNAAGRRIPFYPFALEGVVGRPEMNLADGYHPNVQGVEYMVERIYPLIDAGMRWKLEIIRSQYQQEYQQHMGNAAWGGVVRSPQATPPVEAHHHETFSGEASVEEAPVPPPPIPATVDPGAQLPPG